MSNDYSLLRPFDPEAAKRGEAICWHKDGDVFTYVDGPDSEGMLCYEYEGALVLKDSHYIRMAPLAWVEGRPVYKGDVLYRKKDNHQVVVSRYEEGKPYPLIGEDNCAYVLENMIWTPLKPKTKQVKLVAYFDGYSLFRVADTVEPSSHWKHVPSEDKLVEVEA